MTYGNRPNATALKPQGVIIGKTGYEQSVIVRAMNRAGANPHLKGHIHEILVKDAKNMRSLLSFDSARTELTRSTTASTVDLVTTRGGRCSGDGCRGRGRGCDRDRRIGHDRHGGHGADHRGAARGSERRGLRGVQVL